MVVSFPRRENHVLKEATIKGNNMLPIGSIFFPFRVASMIIENNFKGILGAQWLSGRVLDSRPRGRRFEHHETEGLRVRASLR